MRAHIKPHRFTGTVRVPASKSHTIRRLLLAALTEGSSEIAYPLDSLDARSCVSVCRALGVEIAEHQDGGGRLVRWTVRGVGPRRPDAPAAALDVGNSGTTLFLALAAAALGSSPVSFTGDAQIARRSAGPLLAALSGLGVRVASGPDGCIPITVRGPWKGGRVSLPCPTSQYLSALLIAAPLAPAGVLTEIEVPLLNERPYIELTLSYLKAQNIPWEGAADFSFFRIPGGAAYRPLSGPVPADFSSAAYPGCAAVISGGPATLLGLDPEDPQGDKAVFEILRQMGAEVSWSGEGGDRALTLSRSGSLRGGVFDLNDTPDLLPVLAATAAYARGDTALVNVAHARIKETDRIAVMARELGKLGVACEERPDGLVIHGTGTPPAGGLVDGCGDHRVVMALAAAALGAAGPVEIDAAESAAVTYPGFLELLTVKEG
ncbi:MAG: 3-phosphoshikimate 1-carboxyvinyltransferase [Spirochaetaceae bacterium]|jgi:3-phosphoshikimate 1-carboxyvinyltransferase|nr:3-phosphoshikimate 1-carboxyvinyltransferase [Spirochaetaceae bacterium]